MNNIYQDTQDNYNLYDVLNQENKSASTLEKITSAAKKAVNGAKLGLASVVLANIAMSGAGCQAPNINQQDTSDVLKQNSASEYIEAHKSEYSAKDYKLLKESSTFKDQKEFDAARDYFRKYKEDIMGKLGGRATYQKIAPWTPETFRVEDEAFAGKLIQEIYGSALRGLNLKF